MDMDRRSFLTAGLACAGLAVLPGEYPVADFISVDHLAAIFGLHPSPSHCSKGWPEPGARWTDQGSSGSSANAPNTSATDCHPL